LFETLAQKSLNDTYALTHLYPGRGKNKEERFILVQHRWCNATTPTSHQYEEGEVKAQGEEEIKPDLLLSQVGDNSDNMRKKKQQKKKKKKRNTLPVSDCQKTWREWDDETFNNATRAFGRQFGESKKLVLAEMKSYKTSCLSCDIDMYRRADVLVGLHGAGLTNIAFMRPGSLLVEIVGDYDGRMGPICGYHNPLANVFGIHHYIYFYDWKIGDKLDFEEVAKRAYEFYYDEIIKTLEKSERER